MPQYDEAEGKSGINEEVNEILGDTTELSPARTYDFPPNSV